jgi:hypothetical protein
LALFHRRQLRSFNFTGYNSPSTRHYLLRPFPAGYCRPPTVGFGLAETERGPIAASTPFLSVWHQTGRTLRKNPSAFPRLPPLDRRPFSRGRRRSTPVAPRNPQTPVRRPSHLSGAWSGAMCRSFLVPEPAWSPCRARCLPDLIPSLGVDCRQTVQVRQVRRRDGDSPSSPKSRALTSL